MSVLHADTEINSDADKIGYIMKRVDSIDTGAIDLLGTCYYNGLLGIHMRAAELGFSVSESHNYLGMHYYHGKNWKKAKFHLEAAAMAGHGGARNNIGYLEFLQFNNTDRAIKHCIIAASAGSYLAMNALRSCFENDIDIDREPLDYTLTAYNTSCGEMRSSELEMLSFVVFLGINLEDFN
jgi:TPR repeat protein